MTADVLKHDTRYEESCVTQVNAPKRCHEGLPLHVAIHISIWAAKLQIRRIFQTQNEWISPFISWPSSVIAEGVGGSGDWVFIDMI